MGALRILCWPGYADRALLEPFEAESGVRASGESFRSDYEAAQRVAGPERGRWDVLNINTPFVRDYLFPRGAVRALARSRFEPCFARMLPQYERLRSCAFSPDGRQILGVCQRFGTFNLVVNTRRISAAAAADQGFSLASDARNAGRFGILSYDDFNVFHVAIAAGFDPFGSVAAKELCAFEDTARAWFGAARLVTGEHDELNRELMRGDIDFYISGGVYTCSGLRLAGHRHVRAVTPARGPIGGKGGIVFVEVTAALEHGDASSAAEAYLAYIVRPEPSLALAFSGGGCNPVMQMAEPRVMRAYSREHLDAIQWDELEEDVARCAPYALAPHYEAMHGRLSAARRAAGWA